LLERKVDKMKNNRRPLGRFVYGAAAVLVLALVASFPTATFADTCVGNCGSSGPDGVVGSSPAGGTYQWVSTNLGSDGVGILPTGSLGVPGPGTGETNGSTFATSLFGATAGDPLNFYFNYTSSDGAGFADYAWAALFNSSDSLVDLLFTARTTPSGDAVPGFGVPPPAATLTPATVAINAGQTTWSPLGGSSGTCFDVGCGSTGWILSSYTISTTGNYYLKVGAVNWIDEEFDSGLAFDGITVAGEPITPTPPTTTPEPASLALLACGLLGVGVLRRRSARR
jgi:hypothetical protein